jgi:hypothetical protein
LVVVTAATCWLNAANHTMLLLVAQVLVGSRCGPIDMALELMSAHPDLRALLNSMVSHELPLSEGLQAMALAQTKGVLKVQLICSAAP